MRIREQAVWMLSTLIALLSPSMASAHWCDDLWQSAYNIVVRPASDTVTVPASGSAALEIFVQNNMGYALPNFVLVGDVGGTAIVATRESQKVTGTLLPGEKAKYTLTIKKSGGGQVTVEQINFSVKFGEDGMTQWGMYPTPSNAKAIVIKKSMGATVPASPLSVAPSAPNGQSKQLELAGRTDFIDLNAGLDGLLQLYCAGRGSWNSNSVAVITSWCSSATTTNCQTKALGTGSGTKYDYPKLWAAGELAARKSSLGCARMAVLRDRLKCGIADPNLGFSGFAMIVLGYLGEDPSTRTFIQGKIDGGGDLGTIAKAALLLFGNSADSAKYLADVKTGTSSSNQFVSGACAAALGIVSRDDATISSVLIPKAKWIEPDTGDNGQAMYASHLISLVAWDRRGFAANADDKGAVTFIEGGTPTPFVPGNSCPGGVTTTGGVVAATGGVVAATGGIVVRTGGSVMASGGTVARSGGTATATGGTMAGSGGSVVATGGVISINGGSMVIVGGAVTQTGGNTPTMGGQVASLGGNAASTGGTSATNIGTGTNTGTTTSVITGKGDGGCSYSVGRGAYHRHGVLGLIGFVGLMLVVGRRRRHR